MVKYGLQLIKWTAGSQLTERIDQFPLRIRPAKIGKGEIFFLLVSLPFFFHIKEGFSWLTTTSCYSKKYTWLRCSTISRWLNHKPCETNHVKSEVTLLVLCLSPSLTDSFPTFPQIPVTGQLLPDVPEVVNPTSWKSLSLFILYL